MAFRWTLLATALLAIFTVSGATSLSYFLPEQTIIEDFESFPLCVGVDVQGELNRPAGLDVRLLGISSSLYTYNVGTDATFDGVDDSSTLVGSLTTEYILYGNGYTDLYVGSNGQLSFGSGTDSFSGTFPLSPSAVVLTPFWNDIDLRVGGTIYHRVINAGEELGDLGDRLRTIPREDCLDFDPTSAAVVTFERVSEFGGSPDIHNTFQVILLTNGSTSYSLFLYNSMAWGNGATIGFNDGNDFYTLAGGEDRFAKSTVSGLPSTSNVGIDGVYLFQTQEGSIQSGLANCAGDVEPDYTPFISMQTFTNTLSDFDGSVSELNALVDKFYFNRIPTETFFQSLPITDNFFFCVIVQNELNDEIIENTEELVFSLMTGNSSDVFVTTNSSIAFATVSVFDNDGATLRFNHSDLTFGESVGSVMICVDLVNLMGGLERDVIVDVTVQTAAAGFNNDLNPIFAGVVFGQFTAMAGSVECVNIGVEDDDFVENSETYTLQLVPLNMNDIIDGSSTITVTIQDNDGTTARFNHSHLTVLESDGVATICVELVEGLSPGDLERDVVFEVRVSTGQASASDFTVIANQVVFDQSSLISVRCVDIIIEDDSSVELSEGFSVQLVRMNDNDGTSGTNPITVTIEDNDGATLRFNHSDITVLEEYNATMCVELVSVLGGLERDVEVDITVQSATEDFINRSSSSTRLMFSQSSPNGTVECADIGIEDDTIIEDSELFSVELVPLSENDRVIDRVTITLTIDDNDGAEVDFNHTNLSVLESDDLVEVCILLDGVLGGLERDVAVSVTLQSNTAGALDFQENSTEVTFTQNSAMAGSVECIDIAIDEDDFVENDESFFVKLAPLNGNDRIVVDNITVTIIDNDGLTFAVPEQMIFEDFESFPLCASVDVQGGLERPTGLDIRRRGFVNSLYVYNDGRDARFEEVDDDSTFVGTLSSPYVLYQNTYSDVYVGSNGQVSFGARATAGFNRTFPTTPPLVAAFWNDINTRTGGIIYHRVINAGNEIGDLRDRLRALPGGECLDFAPTSAAVITYERVSAFAGSSDTHNTFQVILLTDGSTSYSLFLYNSMAWGNGATIGFNDGTNFYTLAGGEGSLATSDVLNLPFSSNVGTSGVYVFRTDSASIQSGLDQCPGNITYGFRSLISLEPFTDVSVLDYDDMITDFLNNSMSPEDFFQSFPIEDGFYFCALLDNVDDDVIENTEQVDYSFTTLNANDVFEVSNSGSAFLTVPIFDNDGVEFRFNHSNLTVLESSGVAMVCVELVSVFGGLERDVEISVTVQAATADENDFQLSTDRLVFSQLSSMTQLVECVNITIEDTLVEGSEYFSVEIAPLNENDKIAGVGAITVTIDNDDGVTLQIVQNERVFPEAGLNASICVEVVGVAGGLQRDVIVNGTVQSITTDDADFGVTSFQVIFDESSTDVGSVACYEVPIDDDLIELEEMFFAEIVPLNNEDMIIGNSTSPTLTVVDDDGADIQFNHSSVTVSELDSTVMTCIKLASVLGGLERDVVVNVTVVLGTSEDSAIDGQDFVANSTEVVFRRDSAVAGTVQCVVTAVIQDDTLVEGNEVFSVELVPLNDNDRIIGENTITVTIDDNEGVSVGFSDNMNNLQVSESDGNVTVCIELGGIAGGLERDVVINVDVQSATAGDADFDVNTQQAIFSQISAVAGSVVCVNIAIEEDTFVEVSESFSVALVPTSDDDSVVGLQTIAVTIEDNDGGAVTFDHSDVSVTEALGSAQLCVRLAEVMGGLRRPLVFDVNVLDSGSLSPMIDDDDLSALTVSSMFEPFSIMGAVSCIDIPIVNDNFIEFDEVFTVQLTTQSRDTVIGQEQINVTIMDDDGAVLRLNESAVGVEESVGSLPVCVELVDTLGGLQREVVVGFTAEDITTEDGDDYAEFDPAQTTFSMSSTKGVVQCVRVGIQDDIIIEVAEQFRITLDPANPNDSGGSPLLVTISDNEVDECALGIDMCEQSCINTFPGFMCGCNVGFTLNEDGALCDDVDECMLSADSGADICSSESSLRRCSNTAGSFDCVCPANTRLNEDFNYCLVTIMELPDDVQDNSVVLQITGRTLQDFTASDVENIRSVIEEQYCSSRPGDCGTSTGGRVQVKRQGQQVDVSVFVIGVNEAGAIEVLVYVTVADGSVAPADVLLDVVMDASGNFAALGIEVDTVLLRSDAMTVGEIIGIAVGCAVGVFIILLLVVLLLCCLVCRRRRGGMKPASALETAVGGKDTHNEEFVLTESRENLTDTARNEGYNDTVDFAANLGSQVNESEENLTAQESEEYFEKIDLASAEEKDAPKAKVEPRAGEGGDVPVADP